MHEKVLGKAINCIDLDTQTDKEREDQEKNASTQPPFITKEMTRRENRTHAHDRIKKVLISGMRRITRHPLIGFKGPANSWSTKHVKHETCVHLMSIKGGVLYPQPQLVLTVLSVPAVTQLIQLLQFSAANSQFLFNPFRQSSTS